MCMHWFVRARWSGFARAQTSTFVHRFQNNLAQLFSLRRKSAVLYIFWKVEGQGHT